MNDEIGQLKIEIESLKKEIKKLKYRSSSNNQSNIGYCKFCGKKIDDNLYSTGGDILVAATALDTTHPFHIIYCSKCHNTYAEMCFGGYSETSPNYSCQVCNSWFWNPK